MTQTRVYHWKHGWIPLTHEAAMQKAHGSEHGAAKLMGKFHPVQQEHLPRSGHIVAGFDANSRTFALHDSKSGKTARLTESEASAMHANGQHITGIDENGARTTGGHSPIEAATVAPVPLSGSEKQVAWAEKIRAEALSSIEDRVAQLRKRAEKRPVASRVEQADAAATAARALMAHAASIESASWWVDQRNYANHPRSLMQAIRSSGPGGWDRLVRIFGSDAAVKAAFDAFS